MPKRRLRTADYTEDARTRFGDAVEKARTAANFRSRGALADAAGVSVRAIDYIENAEPRVGQLVLHRVGRALGARLRNWDEGTPRLILEGGPVPGNDPAEPPDLVRIAINALADIEVHGASIAVYNRELNRWKEILADEDVDVEYVRHQAHQVAAVRLAKRVNEAQQ